MPHSDCSQCESFRRQGASYCGACGAELSPDAVFWAAGDGEFARRYTVDDVEGFWTRRLRIEPGQRALVYAGGQLQGELTAGSVEMGGLKRSILSLGRAESMTAVVMRDGPMTMLFELPELQTADNMTVSVSCQVAVQVRNALVLHRNALSGKELVRESELRSALFPIIESEISRAIRELPLQQLTDGPSALRGMDQRLPGLLDDALEPLGLEATRTRVMAIKSERLQQLRGQQEEEDHFEGLVEEHEIAEEDRGFQRDRETSAQELRRERAETVDDVRARNEIRREAERLLIEGKMAHFTNEEDYAEFLAEVDKQGVLRDQHVEVLKRSVREANEDHELARRHAIATLQSEREHELDRLSAEQRAEIEQFEQQQELEMRRVRAEADLDLASREARVRDDLAVQQAETEAEIQRIQSDADMDEMQKLIEIKRLKDEMKAARLQRMQDLELEGERERLVVEQERADREHARELERMQEMGELSTEALIALSDAEQGEIIAELKRTETLADKSEDQILAMAAERSDTVAQAFVERFRAEGEAGGAELMQQMYERMLEERDDAAEAQREESRASREQLERIADRAMETMRDTATASASAGANAAQSPAAPGQTADGQAGSEGPMPMKCPHCRTTITENVHYCPDCGEKLVPTQGSAEGAGDDREVIDLLEFSAFHFDEVSPEEINTMLVYAHTAEMQSEVIADASEKFGERIDGSHGQAPRPISRDAELTVVPYGEGLTFAPGTQQLGLWADSQHVVFRFKADREPSGPVRTGGIDFLLDEIVIGHLSLTIRISGTTDDVFQEKLRRARAQPYRDIFVSYSHRDREVVLQCEQYARSLGDRFIRDQLDLRTGERWSPTLLKMIDEADVFQLFWSTAAATSDYVEVEWRHALQHEKRTPSFIRPVYWRRGGEGFPDAPYPNPPPELEHIHFVHVAL